MSTTINYCLGSLPPPPLYLDRDGGRGKKEEYMGATHAIDAMQKKPGGGEEDRT